MPKDVWLKNFSSVIDENEKGITISSADGQTILRIKPRDYRKNSDGILEVKRGSFVEFLEKPAR